MDSKPLHLMLDLRNHKLDDGIGLLDPRRESRREQAHPGFLLRNLNPVDYISPLKSSLTATQHREVWEDGSSWIAGPSQQGFELLRF